MRKIYQKIKQKIWPKDDLGKMVGLSAVGFLLFGVGIVATSIFSKDYDYKNAILELVKQSREKLYGTDYSVIDLTRSHLEDANNDGLKDLVTKTGEIYLQKKDGSFVSYENFLRQQEFKIDSIYRAKADSANKVYENELEKITMGKNKNEKNIPKNKTN